MATRITRKVRGQGGRGIPQPAPDIASLHQTVEALFENVQLLMGQRGTGGDAAVTRRELEQALNDLERRLTP